MNPECPVSRYSTCEAPTSFDYAALGGIAVGLCWWAALGGPREAFPRTSWPFRASMLAVVLVSLYGFFSLAVVWDAWRQEGVLDLYGATVGRLIPQSLGGAYGFRGIGGTPAVLWLGIATAAFVMLNKGRGVKDVAALAVGLVSASALVFESNLLYFQPSWSGSQVLSATIGTPLQAFTNGDLLLVSGVALACSVAALSARRRAPALTEQA